MDTGSVKVLDPEVANTIRKKQPDRVINSRMVRRLKPQEGTFQKPNAKSRWCVLGHQDPDAAEMFTYAPTPRTESIMMFLFLLQLCDLALSIADLKNAFCQSDSLDRSAGPLFVEPCEGLDLPPGSLIQLVAPVYGLNDAPLRWHRTLTTWLIKQGYRKSLLEPCLYIHYAPGGSVDGLILGDRHQTNTRGGISAKIPGSVSFREVGKTGSQLCWQTNPTTRAICPD